jgi:DNA-binding NtrC family response regulator
MRDLRRILIVEDDPMMMRTLERAVHPLASSVTCAESVAAAKEALRAGVDLVLLDVRLGDGSGVLVAEEAVRLDASPLVIALSGHATPPEAFRLAQLGVRAFLPKPFELYELLAALERVLAAPPDLTPHVKGCVGHADLRSVQTEVRRAMLDQAMALARGNRSVAAKLLSVTRQAVQRMVRSGGEAVVGPS